MVVVVGCQSRNSSPYQYGKDTKTKPKYTCSKDLRAQILQTFTLSYNCICNTSPVEINNTAFSIKIPKRLELLENGTPVSHYNYFSSKSDIT